MRGYLKLVPGVGKKVKDNGALCAICFWTCVADPRCVGITSANFRSHQHPSPFIAPARFAISDEEDKLKQGFQVNVASTGFPRGWPWISSGKPEILSGQFDVFPWKALVE